MISPRVLLVVGGVVLLMLALAVVLIGRSIRARMAVGVDTQPSRRAPRAPRDWAVTPLPTGVARTLTEHGLVNAQQLASMSPAEREFFVATVAARVGQGPKPKLVAGQAGSVSVVDPASGPIQAGSTDGQAAAVSTATLVSGGIHCPVCRALLAQRADTPLLLSRCPGCSRRIGVRVEGNRLSVTVQYGAPTPAVGVTAVRGGRG